MVSPHTARAFDWSGLPKALPEDVAIALTDFCAAALEAFGPALESIVLFGSAAEGRLRATSDVNVLLVLNAFEQASADRVREATRLAYAAVQLRPMFLLADELPLAEEAFAVKFNDILGRRVVLYGTDPFSGHTIPRERIVQRIRQELLNLSIRLRATYVLLSAREEQLAREIADATSPLRSSAMAILALEGTPAANPKEALATIARGLPGGPWAEVLDGLSDAREHAKLAAGKGGPLLLRVIDLASALRERGAHVRP